MERFQLVEMAFNEAMRSWMDSITPREALNRNELIDKFSKQVIDYFIKRAELSLKAGE